MRSRRGSLLLAAALAALATASPPRADAAERVYVALGDSVAVMRGSYVERYFRYLRDPARGDVDGVVNLSRGGETSGSMRSPRGQLHQAVEAIGRPSDVAVLTLDIGGNDGLSGQCLAGFNRDSCPFEANFGAILEGLAEALRNDPGRETFKVMAYYNPLPGTASPLAATYEAGLLGNDLQIECSETGDALGLNDLITRMGRRAGAGPVDTYATFKAAGPRFILDGIHPNAEGHAAIACLFAHHDRAGSPDPCGELNLNATHVQPVLAQRGIVVSARTRGAATVTVSGTVRLPGVVSAVRLRSARIELPAGERRSLRLQLPAATARQVRRALRARHRLFARVVASATDPEGRTYRELLTIRLAG